MSLFKKIFITLSVLLCINQNLQAQFWNLVWADEFNGTNINPNNWTMETGTGTNGWGNNELQYYTARPQNASVVNGQLAIIAKKESYNGSSYTSARMITQGKHSWKYGKIEARIKFPLRQGMWPAFWMLGDSFSTVGWPKCGEIDIMEHINTSDKIHGTIHWDANGYATYGGDQTIFNVSEFHTYAIEWDASSIKWFVDGIQYHSADISNNINSTHEFHEPFFIILNMAVGGNWPGYPNANDQIQDTMMVDYVRVYENSQAPTVLPQLEKQQDIVLYPNPVCKAENFYIKFKRAGNYTLEIYNGLGMLNYTTTRNIDINEVIEVSNSNFSSGIYLLKIINDNNVQTTKLLIEH